MIRPLTSSHVDAKLCQIAYWIGSVVVLFVGMFNLKRLPLSEAEFFFGLLQILAVVLLGVLIGLVLPLAVARDARGLHKEP
jgi:hypothetical protein